MPLLSKKLSAYVTFCPILFQQVFNSCYHKEAGVEHVTSVKYDMSYEIVTKYWFLVLVFLETKASTDYQITPSCKMLTETKSSP